MKRATVLTIAVLLGTASAAVFYVHPESTQNCIQNCLDACCNCDTVLVGPGIYYEHVVWPDTQGIKLISEFGRDTTIIDGGDSGRVITISLEVDTTTVIRGFTIRNGYVDSGGGGGMLCSDSAAPLIEHNRFCDNENADPVAYYSGGGLGCRLASPVVRFNGFNGNRSRAGGGDRAQHLQRPGPRQLHRPEPRG
jgi:hypothetical protein